MTPDRHQRLVWAFRDLEYKSRIGEKPMAEKIQDNCARFRVSITDGGQQLSRPFNPPTLEYGEILVRGW